MDQITLSSNEFKALASETRTGLLKHLLERNHTLTELAQKTELATPTIKQHLEQLETAGLVEQIDDGHKWKYYCLTRKGKTIFRSREEPLPVLILLSVASLTALVLVAALFSSMGSGGAGFSSSNALTMERAAKSSAENPFAEGNPLLKTQQDGTTGPSPEPAYGATGGTTSAGAPPNNTIAAETSGIPPPNNASADQAPTTPALSDHESAATIGAPITPWIGLFGLMALMALSALTGYFFSRWQGR